MYVRHLSAVAAKVCALPLCVKGIDATLSKSVTSQTLSELEFTRYWCAAPPSGGMRIAVGLPPKVIGVTASISIKSR